MKKIIKEFKEFISKGNVIDMAVGIIIGSAFTAIVTSMVNDMIMPIIGIIIGGFDFSTLFITMGDGDGAAVFAYGSFIQAIINFLMIAVCVFGLIKIMNTISNAAKAKKSEETSEEEAPEPTAEELLLIEIRDLIKHQNETK